MLEHMNQEAEKARRKAERKAARELEQAGGPKVQGPVKSQSGKRKSKYSGPERLNNFTLLPGSVQLEAHNLFVEGSTLEDITEFINEVHSAERRDEGAGGPAEGVTLAAVQRFYRGNLELQTQRIKRLQERGEALKKALAGDPNSAEGALADAILFTGMMGMDRAAAQFRIKDAKQALASRQNMRLKEGALRLRTLDSEVARRNVEARTATEVKKLDQLERKIVELEGAMAREKDSTGLGPETLRKIREIYGLASEDREPANQEPQAQGSEPEPA